MCVIGYWLVIVRIDIIVDISNQSRIFVTEVVQVVVVVVYQLFLLLLKSMSFQFS
jgi:uncharacterized membrane protein